MGKKVLAFDFGASSGRAMLGTYENGKLFAREIHRFSNDPVTLCGSMHWDILRLMFEIKQGITKAKAEGGFDAIGIDTWGVDFGLLDENGELLMNPLHYRDAHTLNIPQKVFGLIPKNEIYDRTGIQFLRFNTIYQLYYLYTEKPELMKLCKTMLFIPDLMAYFLTGEKFAEQTVASTSNMLNPFDKQWDRELLKKLSVDDKILPQLLPPGSSYGMLSDEICEELGVKPVPVIAVASHDTASAVVSAPCPEPDKDFCFISCGTWSLFGTETAHPVINEQTKAADFTNEGGYDNTIRLLKNIMGLWLIQESRRQYKREGFDYSFADLEKAALAAKPFCCYIDVDAPDFEQAGNMPKRVMDYCKKTRQYVPQNVGEVIRCIYQSLAFKYKYTYLQLQKLTGKDFSQINVLGGGIKDGLLMQMTANAAGCSVFAGPAEATVTGNIAVQLIALHEIDNMSKARQIILCSTAPKIYEPEKCDEWQQHYDEYIKIIGK